MSLQTYRQQTYKNLNSLFDELDINKTLDLNKVNTWEKSNLLNAYYSDDEDMFHDALVNKRVFNLVLDALSFQVADQSLMLNAKAQAVTQLWAESGNYIQALYDEYMAERMSSNVFCDDYDDYTAEVIMKRRIGITWH